MSNQHSSLKALSDQELLEQTKTVLQRERQSTAVLVAHLAEVDARRLFLGEGCPSMFVYCTEVLHLSEYATYSRIAVARAARKFPAVLESLANGEIHLAAGCLLAPHFTEANHRELLARALHKSKREVEVLVAEIAAKRPAATIIRRVAARPPQEVALPMQVVDSVDDSMADVVEVRVSGELETAVAPAVARSRVQPLSPEYHRVQFSADQETVALLRRAQDLLRHQVPNGDPAAVFKMALAELVKKCEKTKVGKVEKVRKVRGFNNRVVETRYIPASVRRHVWERDSERCAFASKSGRRCTATGLLEFHHVVPFAKGGPATTENIELRCWAHNGYEAMQEFGEWGGDRVKEVGPGYQTFRTDDRSNILHWPRGQ